MNIILRKFSNIIYCDEECEEHILLMDILAIAFGQNLQTNRFKSGMGHRIFLILYIITVYVLISAYESKLRASLITLDVEEPVDNTEV